MGRIDRTARRIGPRVCAAILAILLAAPRAGGVEKTSSTTVEKTDVGKARASYDINRNAAQTTFLDRQITGLAFSPNAFSSTKVQRGVTIDMYYTLVAGSLFGSRRGIGSEFADPVLSQIASVQGKWVVFREGPFWPAVATGLDLNLDFNFRGGFPFSAYNTTIFPSFVTVSKTIYPRTGTYLTLGHYSSRQSEHLAYMTRFLDPKSRGVLYGGVDFKVKDPSKGFRMELFLPEDHVDDAKIMNVYIKAVSAMPLTLLSYVRSDAGRAVLLSLSFRLTFFPSLAREERYKKRWWNPLSWYQDDNQNAAARYAKAGDAFLEKGEYKKAKLKYQESLYLNDKIAGVHYNLASASLRIGTPEEIARAIFHFNRAIELDGPDASKLYGLGLAYFKVGQKDNARQVWSDALKFDPEYSSAKSALSVLEKSKG